MADDLSMQIVLESTNDTEPGFAALDDAVKAAQDMVEGLQKSFDELVGEISAAIEKAAGDIRSLTGPLEQTAEEIATSFEEPSRTAEEQLANIGGGLKSVVTQAEEAANAVAKDFEAAAAKSEDAMSHMGHNMGGQGDAGLFGMSGQMNSMYAGMTLGAVSAPLDLGIKAAVQAFAQFDQSMRLVNEEAKLSQQGFQGLEQSVISLSNQTGISANDLSQGLYNVVATGLTDTTKAMEELRIAAEGAKAGNTDLNTTTKALNAVMGAYGMTADQSSHIMDVMFTAVNNGQMHFDELARSVGASATTAAQAGVGYEELAAAQATLTNVGKSAQLASMNLNSLIMGMLAPTAGATKEAKHLGIEWDAAALKAHGLTYMINEAMKATGGNADALKKLIPNQRAYVAELALGGKAAGQYSQTLNQMKNASGATATALKQYEQGAGASLEQAQAAIKNAGISVMTSLAPALNALAQDVTKIMTAFQNLSPHTRKIIGEAVIATAAITALGATFFMAISGIGALKMGLQGLGLFKVASEGEEAVSVLSRFKGLSSIFKGFSLGGIAEGLGGALKSLGGTLSNFIFGPWKMLTDGIKGLPGLVAKIPGAFSSLSSLISGAFKGALQGVTGFITAIPGKIAALPELLAGWGSKILTLVRSAFSWESIMSAASTALEVLTGPWGALILAVVAGVGAIIANWNTIKSWVLQHFGGTIPTNLNQLKQTMTNVWNAVRTTFTTVWNDIKKVVGEAWAYISPTIIGAVNKVSAFWKEIWPELKQLFVEVWNVMKVIIGPTVAAIYVAISGALGFIKGVWSNEWNIIKSTFKLVWDAIVDVLRVAWDIISGVFKVALDLLTGHWSKAWQDIKTTVANVFGDVGKFFTDLASNAWQWGVNVIQGFIDGVKSMVSSVGNAIGNVANQIKNFLGFHSPTKEGPGSESDQWAPNFVSMFAKGLTDGTEFVQHAANTLMAPLQNVAQTVRQQMANIPGMNVGLTQQASYSLAYAGAGNTQPYVFAPVIHVSGNVTRSEEELADIIQKKIWDKAKNQGKL